jgi:hypothetical protein
MNIFYEWWKKGCLFILFVTLKSPNHNHLLLLCSWYGWKVLNEWVRVHGVGFIMFQAMVEKLLNIEHSFKAKTRNYMRIWARHSWHCWKSLVE